MTRKPFSSFLLKWYSQHKRDLPWREDPSPYTVVISEFMLQQTQVLRVIEKFPEFITVFPTLQDVAHASKAEVIKAWSGLGYNRRALLLHRFAQEVVQKHRGEVPSTRSELHKLPGMGSYTTGALLSFAFNQAEPAIDVNVRRIYLRFFQGKDQGLPMGRNEEQQLSELVRSTIPPGKSRDFHNALMDFGSLVCTRDVPHCGECPLQKSCQFFPLYSTKKEKVLFVMEKKAEPGVYENGKFVPNRIFRGRVVEWVRKNEGKTITSEELGKIVKKDYSSEEGSWLLSLLEKLQEEGFLSYTSQDNHLALSLAR